MKLQNDLTGPAIKWVAGQDAVYLTPPPRDRLQPLVAVAEPRPNVVYVLHDMYALTLHHDEYLYC